jgi:hypothetical protein
VRLGAIYLKFPAAINFLSFSIFTSRERKVDVDMDLLPIQLPSYIKLGRRSKIRFGTYLNVSDGVKYRAATFHIFLQLPVELQVKILEECNAQTLFTLMCTSSHLRNLGKKLFWSQKDVWYYISGRDIAISDEEQKIDSIYWNAQFIKHIEQVEIEFGLDTGANIFLRVPDSNQPPFAVNAERRIPSGRRPPIAANAERYRMAFQRAFPSVKRVVINYSDRPIYPERGIPEDLTTFACALQSHYAVFGSRLSHPYNRQDPSSRDLYRLDSASQWILVQRAWTRNCVLPPTEKISGIVGTFTDQCWKKACVNRDVDAFRRLRHELYEQYHFNGPKIIPFTCPRNGCNTEFNSRAEWREHITTYPSSDHDQWVEVGGRVDYVGVLPAEIEHALLAKQVELDKAMKEVSDMLEHLRKTWGKPSSKRRQLYTKSFLTQLKDDPLCKYHSGGIEKSAIFRELQLIWAMGY